jgi:hypothetical protein
MKIHHPCRKCQCRGRFVKAGEPDFRTDEYQRQKIVARFGVSPDTAGIIATLAGFTDGERR